MSCLDGPALRSFFQNLLGTSTRASVHKLLLHQPPALPGAPQWNELFSEIVYLPQQKGVTYCYRLGLIDCYHVTDSKT